MWNNPVTLATFIGAVTALITAITALLSAARAHKVVNNEIRPQQEKNTEEIKELQNGVNGHA